MDSAQPVIVVPTAASSLSWDDDAAMEHATDRRLGLFMTRFHHLPLEERLLHSDYRHAREILLVTDGQKISQSAAIIFRHESAFMDEADRRSEAYLGVIEAVDKYDGSYAFTSYAMTIALGRLRDAARLDYVDSERANPKAGSPKLFRSPNRQTVEQRSLSDLIIVDSNKPLELEDITPDPLSEQDREDQDIIDTKQELDRFLMQAFSLFEDPDLGRIAKCIYIDGLTMKEAGKRVNNYSASGISRLHTHIMTLLPEYFTETAFIRPHTFVEFEEQKDGKEGYVLFRATLPIGGRRIPIYGWTEADDFPATFDIGRASSFKGGPINEINYKNGSIGESWRRRIALKPAMPTNWIEPVSIYPTKLLPTAPLINPNPIYSLNTLQFTGSDIDNYVTWICGSMEAEEWIRSKVKKSSLREVAAKIHTLLAFITTELVPKQIMELQDGINPLDTVGGRTFKKRLELMAPVLGLPPNTDLMDREAWRKCIATQVYKKWKSEQERLEFEKGIDMTTLENKSAAVYGDNAPFAILGSTGFESFLRGRFASNFKTALTGVMMIICTDTPHAEVEKGYFAHYKAQVIKILEDIVGRGNAMPDLAAEDRTSFREACAGLYIRSLEPYGINLKATDKEAAVNLKDEDTIRNILNTERFGRFIKDKFSGHASKKPDFVLDLLRTEKTALDIKNELDYTNPSYRPVIVEALRDNLGIKDVQSSGLDDLNLRKEWTRQMVRQFLMGAKVRIYEQDPVVEPVVEQQTASGSIGADTHSNGTAQPQGDTRNGSGISDARTGLGATNSETNDPAHNNGAMPNNGAAAAGVQPGQEVGRTSMDIGALVGLVPQLQALLQGALNGMEVRVNIDLTIAMQRKTENTQAR